jgi:hypothetical protein
MKHLRISVRFLSIVAVVLAGCLASIRAKGDTVLAVPLSGQQMDNWCWDASCQMLLSYFGTSVSQQAIADWAVAGADIGNNLDADGFGPFRIPGTSVVFSKKGCKQVLSHFGGVASDVTGALSKDEVNTAMAQNRPAILAIVWNSGGGHAVVLRGEAEVDGDMYLSINDPWPQTGRPEINDVDTGSSALVLYEAVKSGPNKGANYRTTMFPNFPKASAAIGNVWAETLKTTKGLDIIFAIDSTGSMSDDIYEVQVNAANFINSLKATYSDLRVAVMDYKDYPMDPYGDSGDYVARTDAQFTTNATTAIDAINSLYAEGGNDTPEAVYSALMYALDGSALGGWRSNDSSITKRIIIMGDAPGHDPEPWPGGYSYLDVLTRALGTGVRIDAIISGGGSTDAAALASLGTVASETGGESFPAGTSQISSALTQISSNLVAEVRAPRGTNSAIKPVFAFDSLPATQMDAPVKSSYLEVLSKKVSKSGTNWVKYKKIKVNSTSYSSTQPFPTNSYRWHLSYVSSPSKFTYPNGDTAKLPGGSFSEESWTEFSRVFSTPGTPSQLAPNYYFTATNPTMTYSITKAVNADAYAIRIFRGYSAISTNLFKSLVIKPPAKGTNSSLSVKVPGHKVGTSYIWQVQGLNYDRKKPDTNAWTYSY